MKFTHLLFSVLMAVLIFSCKKDEVHVDKYSKYPIVLTGEGAFGGADLAWTAIKSKDFVQYQVFASVTQDSIKDGLENGFIVGASSDPETISLSVSNAFFNNGQKSADSTYYRVVAKLKDRTVLSNNLLITKNNFLQYTGVLTGAFYDKATNTGLFADANKSKLVKINFLTKKIESVAMQFFASKYQILTTTVNGIKEIIVKSTNNSYDFYVYDFNTLKFTKKITTNKSSYGMTTDEKGFIYAADYNSMTIINRQANTQTNYNFTSATSYPDLVFIPNTDRIMTYSSTGIDQMSYLNLSADHKTVLNETKAVIITNNNFSSNSDFSTTVIMDENNFLIPTLFTIKDKDFNDIGTILPSNSNFSNSIPVVAKKNATDYYLQTDTNIGSSGFGADISVFKLPDAFQRKKSYPNIFVSRLFPLDNDELIIMYQSNFSSSSNTTNFEKIKI